MEFYKKYSHIGYSHPGVPNGWVEITKRALIDIEKEIWPRWVPMPAKRWIHWLATGNSVVRVRSRFWHKVKNLFTGGMMVTDVKDKYASLRIYAFGNDKIDEIIKKATRECSETCESCGSKDSVEICGKHWYYNLCIKCRNLKEQTEPNS